MRLAARLAPAGLALVLLVLSLSERDYLRAIGWSPVRRTRTEWPSVLALGPHGWVLTIAFVAAGVLAVPVGWWLLTAARQRGLYAGSILFIVMGAGVTAVAARSGNVSIDEADPESWACGAVRASELMGASDYWAPRTHPSTRGLILK